MPQQYEAPDEILAEIREVVATGAYTLGPAVGEFEDLFAELVGVRHAVGVGTGTDALKLPLRALDIGHGDEVITCANTFIATVGAIAEVGGCSCIRGLHGFILPRCQPDRTGHIPENQGDHAGTYDR